MNARATIVRLSLLLVLAAMAPGLFWIGTADSATETRFDHFTTAFRLEGAHRHTDCESCHVNATFAGTPTTCAGCHTQAGPIRATFQPPTHLPVSKQCDACHRPHTWDAVLRVDHLEVVGSCSSCHNNRIVAGQHPQHIPTTNECDSCHNTAWWR